LIWIGEILLAVLLVTEFCGLLALWLGIEIELGDDDEQEDGDGVKNGFWLLLLDISRVLSK